MEGGERRFFGSDCTFLLFLLSVWLQPQMCQETKLLNSLKMARIKMAHEIKGHHSQTHKKWEVISETAGIVFQCR